VYAEEPCAWSEMLDDEFFWVGLSWGSIAKLAFVQLMLWQDLGWVVPFKFRAAVVESAMRLRDEGCGPCAGVEELRNTLLGRGRGARLHRLVRAQCVACLSEATERRKCGDRARRFFCNRCVSLSGCFGVDVDVDERSCLGSGSFGVVKRGVVRATGEACAVKIAAETSREAVLDVSEAIMAVRLEHENVCKLVSVLLRPEGLSFAFEICGGGDLCDYIQHMVYCAVDEVRDGMAQLFRAVEYMHKQGVVHRDIKPENVLLQGDTPDLSSVRLADFGLAVDCPRGGCVGGPGTLAYMPPEQLWCACNEACDVWALGCVLYECIISEA